MKIEMVPVGAKFRVVDVMSDDSHITFIRTETGALDITSPEGSFEWEDRERGLDNWEEVRIVEV